MNCEYAVGYSMWLLCKSNVGSKGTEYGVTSTL